MEPNFGKIWYRNGKIDRLVGPAVMHRDGAKFWYQTGKLHNLYGPAVKYNNGTKGYWIEGKELSEEEFLARTEAK